MWGCAVFREIKGECVFPALSMWSAVKTLDESESSDLLTVRHGAWVCPQKLNKEMGFNTNIIKSKVYLRDVLLLFLSTS